LKFALSCGSRHELFPEKGAAHLLAHAAFAGTQKESGLRLMRSLENHGCTVGASANREQVSALSFSYPTIMCVVFMFSWLLLLFYLCM
jgi:predicted Zn-dependent peptidase